MHLFDLLEEPSNFPRWLLVQVPLHLDINGCYNMEWNTHIQERPKTSHIIFHVHRHQCYQIFSPCQWQLCNISKCIVTDWFWGNLSIGQRRVPPNVSNMWVVSWLQLNPKTCQRQWFSLFWISMVEEEWIFCNIDTRKRSNPLGAENNGHILSHCRNCFSHNLDIGHLENKNP